MSVLSKLKPRAGARRKSKRVGRGEASGLGKTSGKGHKGQLARSGSKLPVGFEGGQMPLHRRSPKWGFNKPHRNSFRTVNLQNLESAFKANDEVTPESLVSKGLIKNTELPVKILGNGELSLALKLRVHAISKAAKEKVESNKGSVEILPWKTEKKSA